MKGKVLMGGMLGFAAAFGGALWYFQTIAYYTVETPEDYTMRLTLVGDGGLQPVVADDFTVLTAETSPLKFRACFRVANSLPMLTETYRIYDDPTPLNPPSFFDCFDSGQLTEDLAEGRAVAFLAQQDIAKGVDRVVAVYPDGRAFAWHQLNKTFAD